MQARAARSRGFEFTTRRPVAILMSAVAVAVFGMVSYARLPLSLMPDLTYPTITVRTEYPGSAPEEVEAAISRPVEQELGVVSNLVRISSVSRAGTSDVTLEFAWGTDMNLATQETREKLDQVFLPDDANRPLILRYDPALDPVVRLGLHGQRDLYFLREHAEEEIRRELETVPGVAAVKVKGGLQEEIRVELDERKLAAYGLDIQAVGRRLAAANVNLAGGNLEEGKTEYVVRTLNEFRTIDEIGSIAVAERGGVIVRARDLGRVLRDHAERDAITRVNGEESVEIAIYKEADANIVTVARAVRDRVFGTQQQRSYLTTHANTLQSAGTKQKDKTEAKADQTSAGAVRAQRMSEARLRRRMSHFIANELPTGVSITLLADQSTFIENALAEVRDTAIWGGLLAIAILYLFLRRGVSTLIIAVAIPVSIIATFAPMYMAGVSLNIMSLGGLALGIGMLVDNSVVVLESISRCREEGDALVDAVIRGSGEVGTAVIASTLTTVAVFAPIIFVEGVAGQVFGDLSLTIVFSLLTSLLVALFLVPMLASRPVLATTAALASGDDASNPLPLQDAGASRQGNASAGEEGSLAGKIRRRLQVSAARLPSRLLLSLVSGVAAAGKALLLLLMLVSWPLWGWRWSFSRCVSFAQRPTVLGRRPAAAVWPALMIFHAPDQLAEAVRGIGTIPFGSNPRPPVNRLATTGGTMLWLISVPYLALVRAPLQIVLAGLGKILLAGSIAIALAVVAVVGALAMIFGVLASPFVAIFDRGFSSLRLAYPLLLRATLRRPVATTFFVAAITVGTLATIAPQLGRELIPEIHQGVFDVQARLPVGTPVETTDKALEPLERLLRNTRGVESVATVVGVDREEYDPDPEAGENSGKFTVRLARANNPVEQENQVIRGFRSHLVGLPNLEAKISRPTLFTARTPIEVEVRGNELGLLRKISLEVASQLATIPGFQDVKSSLQRGNPEIQIHYDRELLARFGLDIAQVAALVRNKVQGDVATEFRRGDRRIDIRVKVRPQDRATVEDLSRLVVNPGQSRPIRLESVADLVVREGPSEIRRLDQQRAAVISANTTLDLATATTVLEQQLQKIDVPGDFSFAVTGQREEMERSTRSLLFALALAIFLVYVVMASQFESLLHPFVILFSIPMAAVGVVCTLYVLDISLSVVVLLGCIMLAGIVVNNAIVLVDYINHLRRNGMQKIEAIVQAGSVRLRPILMTTSTTVIGLLPMAIGMGDGAEIRTPMAITVIAGLLTSTLLTLVLVPVLYNLMDRRP
ncbi:MAG: efflux RND transporter permease subunit [Acidobacteriota bacterium]